ncbi:MAG TPA: omptin family outer membrane protease [Treponema sp.]|nr:omptin family outer membrane protease [Treponema sp.]HPC71359.1 omptin family outer membrane protease [Treponema sp.]HRS05309.1 omptin family outer membrane protease [Treponema sp.]HRU29993.1 omptin family outer membrane protease [Treponema sp.]
MSKKPAYLLCLFIPLITTLGLAEPDRHHWSIDNSLGLTYGHARELVYQDTGSKDLMSELVWPQEGLLFYGTSIQYNYGKSAFAGFYTTLSVRFGFSMQSGTITDKDWLCPDGSYFLTHFSAHDAISEHSQWVDAALGYGFILSDSVVIRTGFSASLMNLHWIARDGYTQYGSNTSESYSPWSSSFPKIPIYGTGIAYWQNWLSLAPVLEVLWQATDRLSVLAGSSLFILNSCSDQDDHYFRLDQFTEKMAGGFGLEPRLALTYQLVSNISLGFDASWRYITGLRGNTTIMEIGSGITDGPYADTAGADYSVGRAALYIRFSY